MNSDPLQPMMITALRARARERLLPTPSIEAFDPDHLPKQGDHRLADNLEIGRAHV